MKRLQIALVILILIMGVFSACIKKEFVIKGQMGDTYFEKVELIPMSDYEVLASADIAEDGTFTLITKGVKEGEYLLKFSEGNLIAVYIGKTGDLNANIKYNEVMFNVEFTGDYSDESNYVNNIRQNITNRISDFASKMIKLDIDIIDYAFDNLRNDVENIVSDEITKNKKLMQIHRELIPYIIGTLKLKYEIMLRDQSATGVYELPVNFDEYKESISFENKDLVEYDDFVEFIRLFYRLEFTQEMLKVGPYNLAQYCETYFDKFKDKQVSKRAKDIVLYTGMNHYINDLVNAESDDLINRVINNFSSSKFKKGIKDSYKTQKGITYKLSEGSVAPIWSAIDIKGNTITLETYRGHYVFVDVWATWCAPCVDQIPHLTKLASQYRAKNIKFISISIDTNIDLWKKFVTQRSDEVIQLINSKGYKSEFVKQYEINSIPRFMIFDRQGKVISVDTHRPSDPALQEYINNILNQQQ